jgi:hypothetical protein
VKGGEAGEGAHRATFFLLAYRNYWGNSEVWGGVPLTGLDKTLRRA